MNNLINIKNFLEIFTKNEYRLKLDNAVLDFFGLTIPSKENTIKIEPDDIIITINVLYECVLLFKIQIKDTKNLFSTSKNFYLNLTNIDKNRPFELIMPGFWNIYYKYNSKNILAEKKIVQIGRLFTLESISELKAIFTNLNFNNNEINDIIDIVTMKK